ncbi:hypothetical protein RFI_21105 [Reticulomyxa filosa]|uniref:Uncharacterized protein n=1 Tax=Reticulomyxa filosa TaxID=46433 RepID=X6MQG3_RETFI|nr:hypothetical protein RFI_21105 [Reticulomyxa filosa]|eukprot:ETO16248.1 hypothetical protein RFI_21105 [Reticulomyxa filosa]
MDIKKGKTADSINEHTKIIPPPQNKNWQKEDIGDNVGKFFGKINWLSLFVVLYLTTSCCDNNTHTAIKINKTKQNNPMKQAGNIDRSKINFNPLHNPLILSYFDPGYRTLGLFFWETCKPITSDYVKSKKNSNVNNHNKANANANVNVNTNANVNINANADINTNPSKSEFDALSLQHQLQEKDKQIANLRELVEQLKGLHIVFFLFPG